MPALDFFINESASDPSQALVAGFFTNQLAAPVVLPQGDNAKAVRLHFLTGNPDTNNPSRPFIYSTPPAAVTLAAGRIDAVVDGGTFTVTDGVASQTTAAIAYNASAATFQAALRTGCPTNFGAALVTGDAGGPWRIDRVLTGAFANLTATTAGITPAGSAMEIINTENGDSLLSEKWHFTLSKAPAVLTTSWTANTPTAAAVSTVTGGSAGVNEVQRITIQNDVYGGSFSLSVTLPTTTTPITETIGPIPYNASEDDIVAFLEGHSSDKAVEGSFAVSKTVGASILIDITFKGDLGGTNISAMTIADSMQYPLYLEGTLNCRTSGVLDLLNGSSVPVNTNLEIEKIVSGNTTTVAFREDCQIKPELISSTPGTSSALQEYMLAADGVRWDGNNNFNGENQFYGGTTFNGPTTFNTDADFENGIEVGGSSVFDAFVEFNNGIQTTSFVNNGAAMGFAGYTITNPGADGKMITTGNLEDMMDAIVPTILEDVRSSGTQGGATTAATWITRTLQTITSDAGGNLASALSSNTFTLVAGTYNLEALAQAFSVQRCKIRLYNVTDSTVIATGRSCYATASAVDCSLNTTFTIAAGKALRIEFYGAITTDANDTGVATSDGSPERYMIVKIWRTA